MARAKELIYTARKIDAKTAYDYGIVQYVTGKGQGQGSGSGESEDKGDRSTSSSADEMAMHLAREMAQNGPIALRAAKRSINQGMECASLKEAMQIEKTCYQQVLETEDRLEGLAAFKEKRKPNYKGC